MFNFSNIFYFLNVVYAIGNLIHPQLEENLFRLASGVPTTGMRLKKIDEGIILKTQLPKNKKQVPLLIQLFP